MTPPRLKTAASRGRPKKTTDQIAEEVELVNGLALALKQGRTRRIEELGFNERTALRAVMKRRRGPVRELIGTSAVDLIAPTVNKTARAIQLIIEHGFPVNLAARIMGVDVRNLRKKLPAERRLARLEQQRQLEFSENFTVNHI